MLLFEFDLDIFTGTPKSVSHIYIYRYTVHVYWMLTWAGAMTHHAMSHILKWLYPHCPLAWTQTLILSSSAFPCPPTGWRATLHWGPGEDSGHMLGCHCTVASLALEAQLYISCPLTSGSQKNSYFTVLRRQEMPRSWKGGVKAKDRKLPAASKWLFSGWGLG